MDTNSQLVGFLQMVLDEKRRGKARIEDLAVAVDKGQLDLFNYYADLPVGQGGAEPTVPAAGYGASQAGLDALRPFRTIYASPLPAPSDGRIALPPDFARLLGLFRNDNGALTQIPEVLTSELDARLKSKMYPVTSTSPVFVSDGGMLQCYPQTAIKTQIHYLRRPATVVITYTVNGKEQEVDDNGLGSSPPQFNPVYWPQICTRALAYLGVSLSDADVLALSQIDK